jgi:mono/diheme cytochrome c family protein
MRLGTLLLLVAIISAGCEASSGEDSQSSATDDDSSMRVERALFQKGKTVFSGRCAVCHGENADGSGPMARAMEPPKPADFRQDRYANMPVDSIRRVIVEGGAATGRNPRMPAWGEELTGEEIEAVIAFVRSVSRFGQMPTEQQVQDAPWIVN